jgi:hypothetical protein
MDHREIDESQIVERYLLRALPAGEEALFEEHLADCGRCLDRLEAAERFRRGLETVVKEDRLHAATSGLAGAGEFRASLARLYNWLPPVALAGAALLLLAALGFSLYRMNRTARELQQAKAAYEDVQRQNREQQAKIETLMRREHSPDTPESGGAYSSLPAFALALVRGSPAGWRTQPPPTMISIPPDAPWIVLALEVPPDAQVEYYRARILDHNDRVVWQDAHIAPQSLETLAIGLRPAALAEGNHRLALESCNRSAGCMPSSSYAFRVVPARAAPRP